MDKKRYKRYIKLSRYTDITNHVRAENIPLQKRIFISEIKSEYPYLYNLIKGKPPIYLKNEQTLLKKHFNIDSTLKLEAIRKNLVDNRCGKITARWVLFIYANNIDKYISEIGFMSTLKRNKLTQMKSFKSNKPQYTNLKTIKTISNSQGFFSRSDFVKTMKVIGYKSPGCFLYRYLKSGKIVRVKTGHYKILF